MAWRSTQTSPPSWFTSSAPMIRLLRRSLRSIPRPLPRSRQRPDPRRHAMAPVDETELPGVGTRFSFETGDGRLLGVIRHHDGRREVFIADREDPDCVAVSVSLEEGESHILADLLGGTEIAREVTAVAQGVAGLTVDWVEVPGLPAPATIGALQIRSRTGASVVAVLRGSEPYPAPGPDFSLAGGDVVLVVGTASGVREARNLLQGGGS